MDSEIAYKILQLEKRIKILEDKVIKNKNETIETFEMLIKKLVEINLVTIDKTKLKEKVNCL